MDILKKHKKQRQRRQSGNNVNNDEEDFEDVDNDSDDDEVDLHRSVSQPTLTSVSSNGRIDGSDEGSGPVDVWDL